jgi:hypothetical protein
LHWCYTTPLAALTQDGFHRTDTDKMPRENLVCLFGFEFDRLGRQFDFALAHSLVNHLTFNRIRQCLERLIPVMKNRRSFLRHIF